VFLVLFSILYLSCQKDNGVESAGNNSKEKPSLTNNGINIDVTSCPEDNPSYEAIMELYEFVNGKIGSRVFIYDFPSPLPEIVNTNNVSDYYVPLNHTGQFALKVIFKWNNCLPYCENTMYSSSSPRVAIFAIADDDGVIFGTNLRKPYGSTNGQGPDVTGEDSFLYAPLVNNYYQLEAGHTYHFNAWWVWCPEPTKNFIK